MNKVREFLKGKKAYITAAIGLLGAVVAWADGKIDAVALLAGCVGRGAGLLHPGGHRQ